MKNTMLNIGLAGLATVLLSFTLVQKSDKVQEPKKTRHIKMMKVENGKKMELDTVLTTDDVFVWNGDTINPIKHNKNVNPSGFDKMKKFDVKVENKDGKNKVIMIKDKDGKDGEPMIWNMDTDENMEIVTDDIDSVGEKIVIRKRMKDDAFDHMIFLNEGNMKHFPMAPPVPPVPPMPNVRMMKMQHAGQIIDLNDPNIISFRKKKLSGDREKIEIIRKKSEDPQNMSFDFNFDDDLMAPPAPENTSEFDLNNQKMKVTSKEVKVDGKNGKEIKVEVESKENK